MITIKRTNSDDNDFGELVKALDIDLSIRDGAEHSFYAQFNKINTIKYVVVAYQQGKLVGCGAIKEYDEFTMEVKRMFVPVTHRGQGIATIILTELEKWCSELNIKKCLLETGKKQPEAIRLYTKNNYKIIANFCQYKDVANSVCFEKILIK